MKKDFYWNIFNKTGEIKYFLLYIDEVNKEIMNDRKDGRNNLKDN